MRYFKSWLWDNLINLVSDGPRPNHTMTKVSSR